MAREFFKNLPDTTTPLNAQRMNNFLNGEEAMGSIVVDDITCKNVLPNLATSRTINGITFTVNEDKSITISGTATDNADLYLVNTWGSSYTFLTLNSEYTLSLGTSNPNICLYLVNGTTVLAETTSQKTQTFTNKKITCAFIRVYKGGTVNKTVYPQLEKGSIATDYTECKEFSNKQVYSINEQKIGAWINGKTLYSKTIELGTLPNNGKIQYATGISSSCTIVKIDTLAINPTDNSTIPINYYNNTLAMWWYTLVDNNKHLFVVTNNGNISTHKGIITIYYTKD